VADSARSILDGHIVLDRELATANHYPAIDVLGSVSRVAPHVTTSEVQASGAVLKRLLAAYREAKILVEVGAYVSGSNADVDRAIALMPRINAFLRQPTQEVPSLKDSQQQLLELVGAQ
jgi:flagellum-specific ATP synthase